MIIFAHPQYLLLLLLIPFGFVGLALWMGARRRRLRKLGDEALLVPFQKMGPCGCLFPGVLLFCDRALEAADRCQAEGVQSQGS